MDSGVYIFWLNIKNIPCQNKFRFFLKKKKKEKEVDVMYALYDAMHDMMLYSRGMMGY